MSSYWNFKLIFDPATGIPAGTLDKLLGLLERRGYWAWTKAEDVPPYAISRPQTERVLVVSTFVEQEYKTLLATDLEVVETLLTEHGGSLELRPHAPHSSEDMVELRITPAKHSVSIGFPWPESPIKQQVWPNLLRQMCDRLEPWAACAYDWEALAQLAYLTDDLHQAALDKRLPQNLHSLTYLSTAYLQQIGLERLTPASKRLDYWKHGVCIWLERELGEFQLASLEENGLYQRRSA